MTELFFASCRCWQSFFSFSFNSFVDKLLRFSLWLVPDNSTAVCLDVDLFLLIQLYSKIHGFPNFPNPQTFLWITGSTYSYFIHVLLDEFWSTLIHISHLFLLLLLLIFPLYVVSHVKFSVPSFNSYVFQPNFLNMWQLSKQEVGNSLHLFSPLSSTSFWATSFVHWICIGTAPAWAFTNSHLPPIP